MFGHCKEIANTIACSIVSTQLDYCKSIVYRVVNHNIERVQRVQNSLARVVPRNIGHPQPTFNGRCTGFRSGSTSFLRLLPSHTRYSSITNRVTYRTSSSITFWRGSFAHRHDGTSPGNKLDAVNKSYVDRIKYKTATDIIPDTVATDHTLSTMHQDPDRHPGFSCRCLEDLEQPTIPYLFHHHYKQLQ